ERVRQGHRREDPRAFPGPRRTLAATPQPSPPVPPHVAVWRSVRVHGETKTERSRRTLGLPQLTVEALRALLGSRAEERLLAGGRSPESGLGVTTSLGSSLAAPNVAKLVYGAYRRAGAAH